MRTRSPATGPSAKNREPTEPVIAERETGPFITLASIHASLGNKDKAFELLEKSYQQRDSRIVDTNVDAMLDSVRPDARFDDLVRRMGLTP